MVVVQSEIQRKRISILETVIAGYNAKYEKLARK